jgi:hypothetical protein
MDKITCRKNNLKRPGFALLLMFILTFGIAAIVMVMYLDAFNPFSAWQGSEKTRYSDNKKPWEEDHLIWGGVLEGYDMSGRRPPFNAQPKIKDVVRYEAPLVNNGKPMGTIKLSVFKTHDAISSWQGEFEFNGKHYSAKLFNDKLTNKTVNALSGNIYPLKIYEDQKGKDRSRLYVITAGSYFLQGPQKEDFFTGSVYINAWLTKKLSAEGTLAIPAFDNGKDLIAKWGPVEPYEK